MSSENSWFDRMIKELEGSGWIKYMWDGDWKYISVCCDNGNFKAELWKEKPQLVDGEWKGSIDRELVVNFYSDEITEAEYVLWKIAGGGDLVEVDDEAVVNPLKEKVLWV